MKEANVSEKADLIALKLKTLVQVQRKMKDAFGIENQNKHLSIKLIQFSKLAHEINIISVCLIEEQLKFFKIQIN